MVILAEISLLRVTKAQRIQLLLAPQSHPGPDAANLFTAMVPTEVFAEWHGEVSYRGGRHKAAIPRNPWESTAEYLH